MRETEIKWSVVGHEKQKEFLKNALLSDRVSQFYLLVGPDNVGKTSLAIDFSKAIKCYREAVKPVVPCQKCEICRSFRASADHFLLDSVEEIKIDDIRLLKKRFAFAANRDGHKTAVIGNAQNLNREAANAFLKLLEEPAGATTFLFALPSLGWLPQTIVSRGQKVIFTLNTEKDFQNFIKQQNIAATKTQQALALRRIGLLKRILEDEDQYLSYSRIRDLDRLSETPGLEFLNQIMSLHDVDSQQLRILFTYWLLLENEKTPDTLLKNSLKKSQAIAQGLEMLTFNANKKLVLDSIAVSI